MDLAELPSLPGVKEECVLRSGVGLMALHGGSQDRGTDEIASRAAEQAGASYYAIVQSSKLRVHLTSRHHSPITQSVYEHFSTMSRSLFRSTDSDATVSTLGSILWRVS